MNAKTAQCRTLNISKSQARHKKSYQGKLCRVHAEGWERSFTAIERVFIKCSDINDLSTYNELLDEWGFRRDNIAGSHNILQSEDVFKLDGGLIVDDGDSGKTVFLNQLEYRLKSKRVAVLFVAIREFRGREEEIFRKIQKFTANRKNCYILLDALDEAPDIIEKLFKTIERAPKKIHWWITTRPLLQLSSFQEHTTTLPKFKLLPFSIKDVHELARQLCDCPETFFESVRKMEVQELCLKPGGLIVLLRIYKAKGLLGTSRLNLMELVVKDYCVPRRDGKIDEAMPSTATAEDRLIDAMGWLSLCMILSGSDQCWTRDIASTPRRCVAMRSCITERYTFDDLSKTLATRFIEPMGDWISKNCIFSTYGGVSCSSLVE